MRSIQFNVSYYIVLVLAASLASLVCGTRDDLVVTDYVEGSNSHDEVPEAKSNDIKHLQDYEDSKVVSIGKRRSIGEYGRVQTVTNSPTDYLGINSDDIHTFNPVLQDTNTLGDWLSKYKPPTTTKQAESDGSRSKRSLPSMWCDSGSHCSKSLCPWEEVLDVEPGRTPMIIKYARCLSSTCNFNFAGLDPNVRRLLQLQTACDQITTDVRVRVNNREKWLTDWPIACMCTRRLQAPLTHDIIVDRLPSLSSRSHVADEITNVENSAANEPRMQDAQPPQTITRQARRLIRKYQRQQRRRQNKESWRDLMMRRRGENNT